MKRISKSIEETRVLATELVSHLKVQDEAVVIALEGDLGSGKTTFSQFVGEALGVRDAIVSPTFLIEKIYELHKQAWKHLVHIDTYRLEDPNELIQLGWNEIIQKPENIILVEWADRIKNILPDNAIHIVFKHAQIPEENTREINIA